MGLLAGALAFDTDARRWTYFSAAVLMFGLIFFVALGLALVVRGVSPYPALRVDATGVSFRSVPFMLGHIPFSNVSQVRALRYGAAQYIAFRLKNEEMFMLSQPRLLRPALRYLLEAGHPTCVVLVGVGRGEEQREISERVRAAIQKFGEYGDAA